MKAMMLHGVADIAALAPASAQHSRDFEMIQCGPLKAIVSTADTALQCDDVTPEVLSDAALNHHRHLCSICDHLDATDAIVPIRFGALFSCAEAVVKHVTSHHLELMEGLTQLRGKLEFAITVDLTAQPKDDPGEPTTLTGRDYLIAQGRQRDSRRAMSQERSRFVTDLANILAGLSHHTVARQTQRANRLADFAALVSISNGHELHREIEATKARQSALGVAVTQLGPLPPYSFTAGGQSADE